MKKIVLLSLLALVPAWAIATEIEIDGINYNINKEAKTAEVIRRTYFSYSGTVVIPSSIRTYEGTECAVTSIGGNAFKFCTGLTSVTIPNSITTIGNSAFQYCI